MIKGIIVDDEPKAIKSLAWELSNFSDEIEIIKTFTVPEEALSYINLNKIDCLFLDIEMPTMDGFQFINQLKRKDFAIIITTAYNDYAIEALKNEAIDYLLKPVDTDDLQNSLKKIKKFNYRLTQVDNNEKFEEILIKFNEKFHQKKIIINTDGKLLFLEASEILYIESDGNYSTIFTINHKKIVVTKKLKEINELLPNDLFFRIHNSYIINLDKVREFYKTDGYVIIDQNHKIPVSRQRKSAFLDKF
ncbi:LytTR family DNA-binding domain-containing protein [Tenacibaculum sp. IB213877]|uniref:LytR/AlgR family response regulator transcription factor n=1 Tax=Tenacibaculum sp. IB213877 TaxID=3097351 RepID=UPI002A59A9B1|nr:LytTR family DNA-binding domain-containing protein [Tenacibaculum sp. IB213877]MDY0780349.1 LytTR family DNA-binding domain-containing protein [Tenacibaculum sp. IB213877]